MTRVWPLVGVLVLVALAGCDVDDEAGAKAPASPPSNEVKLSADAVRTADIRTAPVERRRLERILELTGTLAALPWTADEQAALSDAESADARRRLAETSFARQQQLAAQGIAARQTLDAARAERDAARAAAASADARLANLGLGAGARVLERRAGIWGLALLPESDLGAAKPGDPVEVRTTAFADRRFTGHVVAVSRSSDPATHGFTLRVALDDPSHLLHPQMLASFRIATPLAQGLVVPRSAVLLEGDGDWVYVAHDGVFRRTAVRTGSSTPTELEVVSGLAAGDRVVVAGAQLLESERLKSTLRISD